MNLFKRWADLLAPPKGFPEDHGLAETDAEIAARGLNDLPKPKPRAVRSVKTSSSIKYTIKSEDLKEWAGIPDGEVIYSIHVSTFGRTIEIRTYCKDEEG